MIETIGERLKRLRKSKKLSQTQLAKAVGLSQSAIGNIEAGTRGYGAKVAKIADLLGVTPDYLQLQSELPAASVHRIDASKGGQPSNVSVVDALDVLGKAIAAHPVPPGSIQSPPRQLWFARVAGFHPHQATDVPHLM